MIELLNAKAKELKARLWQELKLDDRAIIFHTIDVGHGTLYYGSGLIDSQDALYESDMFSDIASELTDEREINVTSVETYMIGCGESESADWDDCRLLAEAARKSPRVMDTFLWGYADCLACLSDFTLENTWYEGEDEDDE